MDLPKSEMLLAKNFQESLGKVVKQHRSDFLCKFSSIKTERIEIKAPSNLFHLSFTPSPERVVGISNYGCEPLGPVVLTSPILFPLRCTGRSFLSFAKMMEDQVRGVAPTFVQFLGFYHH